MRTRRAERGGLFRSGYLGPSRHSILFGLDVHPDDDFRKDVAVVAAEPAPALEG